MRIDYDVVSASSSSFVKEEECVLISDEERMVLSRCGETIIKFVKLSVDPIPTELLQCYSSVRPEFSDNDDVNEIVKKSIHAQRMCRFPIENTLDDLVVHPTILSLAAQALFPKTTSEELSSRDCWFGFPRLLEAHLVFDIDSTAPDDVSYRKNTINQDEIDVIVLKINLPLLADQFACVELTKTMDWVCQSDICWKQPAFGSIADKKTATATGVRIVFATSCQDRPDYGGGSYIRYVAGGKWFAALSPLQRASLGFPPPGHWYWQQKGTLRQAMERYEEFGFDPLPYNVDYYTIDNNEKNHVGNDMHCNKNDAETTDLSYCCDPNMTYKDPKRLIEPESVVSLLEQQDLYSTRTCNTNSFDRNFKPLSAEQVEKFHNDGYLFLENVFPLDVIENAVLAANELWPEYSTTPSISPKFFSFPFEDARLNEVTLHPNLLAIICQLLHVPLSDLRLTQSTCLAKRGVTDGDDVATDSTLRRGNQPMHLDFGNNTLLTPARSKFLWNDPEEVQGILYYVDHTDISGGTAVVKGLQHIGIPAKYGGWLPDEYEDDPRPSLYSKERKVAYGVGSMLLYQLGTWHRGTPVIHGSLRRIHHLCFRKATATWIGSAPEFGQPTLTTSLIHHSNILDIPFCRTLLGFNVVNKNTV